MIHKKGRVSFGGKALKFFSPKVRKAIKCYKGFRFKTKMVSMLAHRRRVNMDSYYAISQTIINERCME